MRDPIENLIVGQGIAGTTLAWQLHLAGRNFVILDADEKFTASKVAAGLVTPWTGRRMTQSADFDESWAAALLFYREVEQRLSFSLFEQSSAVRLFVSKSDASLAAETTAGRLASLEPWTGQIQAGGRHFDGCRMQPAGRLDVRRYLRASADFFAECNQWYRHRVELPAGLTFDDGRAVVEELNLSADRVILCTGASRSPLFPNVPNNPAKGEILNVTVAGYQCRETVHHSIWLVPEEDGSMTVGATYDWDNVDCEPTAQGRREILNAMRRFIDGEILPNEHSAAIRPTMKDYQPVIGRHSRFPCLFIFNGLGSRGVLRAPRVAQHLVSLMLENHPISPEYSIDRLQLTEHRQPLTRIAQERVSEHIREGDSIVDATVGNGFDTCFLANCVGPAGTVYGFDVQPQAIESTRRRLEAAGLANVSLIGDSHERLSEHIQGPFTAAMFNLGYLPGSDHAVITRPESTIAALEQVRERLQPGGVITILAYRGHDGGPEEADAVERWLDQQDACTVERINSPTGGESAPVLFVLVEQQSNVRNPGPPPSGPI